MKNFFTIGILSFVLIGCGESISKTDLENCWAYESIASDLALSQGRLKPSTLHHHSKNAYRKIAENNGVWNDKSFEQAIERLRKFGNDGNSSEITKIGKICSKISDSNKEWSKEFNSSMDAVK